MFRPALPSRLLGCEWPIRMVAPDQLTAGHFPNALMLKSQLQISAGHSRVLAYEQLSPRSLLIRKGFQDGAMLFLRDSHEFPLPAIESSTYGRSADRIRRYAQSRVE